MSKSLPSQPNLEQLKNQAKDLLKEFRKDEPSARDRVREHCPDWKPGAELKLHDAQLVIAREYGFANWPKLKDHVESILLETVNPLELLKNAFHDSNATLFRKLLDRYPQFKARLNDPIGPFDSPPITHVCTPEMLDVMLDAGADINAKSRWWAGGFGLLHNAKPELAKYAITRGAVVDVHAAARLGMMERLRELVAANPKLVHARGGDGQTPLHFASTVEIARYLLDHGADLNIRDIDHESTPAQWMIKERQDVARFLVERGCEADILMAAALGNLTLVTKLLDADPQRIHTRVTSEYFPMINPKSGGTIYQWTLGWHVSPHQVARQFGHENVFLLLMERSPADVKLIAACWDGDVATVNSLVTQSPQLVSTLRPEYRRHIAHAARDNILPAVRTMLGAGLPVDALGQHGATPLHWASWHGNAEMVAEILRHNPPLEQVDGDYNSTPLGWTIHGSENGEARGSGDYPRTADLLLKAGAKIPDRTDGTDEVKAVLKRFKKSPDDERKFVEYEQFSRRVLVDILGWSEPQYAEFALWLRTFFQESEAEMFFHDLPYKYVCRKLLSEKLKQMYHGGDAIQASYMLIAAMAGSGLYEDMCKKDFDIESSRKRYVVLLNKLERGEVPLFTDEE